ncbi:MAG: flagellar FlbD family protein [Chloroflexota bacterium]
MTRLDGSELTINCDLLESVEHTPDTVISLLNGHKLVVKESVAEIVDRAVEYRQRLHLCPLLRDRLDVPLANGLSGPNPVR